MSYKQLEEEVIAFAKSAGKLDNLTPKLQVEKTIDEVNKLSEAIEYQERGTKNFMKLSGDMVSTNEEIRNALGNAFITLIVQARLQHLTLEECLQIKKDGNYEGPIIL